MTKAEANKLAKRIAREAPACRVTGTRDYGKGSYSLDVLDTVSGTSFVVHSAEAWAERQAAAAAPVI